MEQEERPMDTGAGRQAVTHAYLFMCKASTSTALVGLKTLVVLCSVDLTNRATYLFTLGPMENMYQVPIFMSLVGRCALSIFWGEGFRFSPAAQKRHHIFNLASVTPRPNNASEGVWRTVQCGI